MGIKHSLPDKTQQDGPSGKVKGVRGTSMSESRRGKFGIFGRQAKLSRESSTTSQSDKLKGKEIVGENAVDAKKNGEKVIPFRPAGLETWRMIDDDSASGRSRSSSREKTLGSKVKKGKSLSQREGVNTRIDELDNAQMTSSLPVNLDDRGGSLKLRRLIKSNTLDSQRLHSTGTREEARTVPLRSRNSSDVEAPCLTFSATNAAVKDQVSRSLQSTSSGRPKSIPAVQRKSKGFLFSGFNQTKSVSATAAHPHVSTSERSEEKSSTEISSVEETKEESTVNDKVNKLGLTRKDSGQGSSLDACHVLTPKSHSSASYPIRQVSESEAPLASIEFDESSLCSIGSDDLMMDMDISLDNPVEFRRRDSRQSRTSVDSKKRLSGARLSTSFNKPFNVVSENSYSSEQKVEQPGSVIRKQRSSIDRGMTFDHGMAQTGDLRHQKRFSGSGIDSRYTENTEKTALTELITLMEGSQLKPRLNRLSSADNVVSSSGEREPIRRQFSLRPPTRTVVIDEREHAVVDGFSYRSMMQELTSMKTMLFKLKRMIQEDELHAPALNSSVFRNGSKSSSQQLGVEQLSSTFSEENGFTDLAALPDWGGSINGSFSEGQDPSIHQLMEENENLRSMILQLRQKLHDQETTISLLQQQMTKYECGKTDTSQVQ